MSNKAWGGRFKQSVSPLMVKFNDSLHFDHVLYHYDIQGSIVHANMLARQGLLTQEEAQNICLALKEIEQEIENGEHALESSCEDIHMFIEQLLTQKIGVPGKKLHTGRSRNDQVALDLRLYTRDAIQQISACLSKLSETLSALKIKHANDLLPGYTHLQQAQPILLGQYFGAYQAMIERDMARLADCEQRMNFSPLGAGALAGSILPLDREWVASQLGFSGIIENTLDAVSDRDFLLEFQSIAAIVMVHLSRLCEDLIIWNTAEFGFIELSDLFATGSSMMPNKKNPDVLELMRGKSGRVFGNLIAMLTMMKALPLAYNKDMQEDKEGLFDTVKTLLACLEILPAFLMSITFNTEHMYQKATSGFLNATHIAEELVLKGVPFREAHHIVGQWVSQAIAQGKSLSEVMQEQMAG